MQDTRQQGLADWLQRIWHNGLRCARSRSLRLSLGLSLGLSFVVCGGLGGCERSPQTPEPEPQKSVSPGGNPMTQPSEELLRQSWRAYRDRFIQADGRVIDREAADRSTSEGQAYALLRAVLMDDPGTFDRLLQWSENNLRRSSAGKPLDQLWAWKWGRDGSGEKWGILDINFASDADIDAVTALIVADRRWNRPEYLRLARAKLEDLWNFSTLSVGDYRYLLPGPSVAFRQRSLLILNPSYFAPYAFRLFAQVDSAHDWNSLVVSSYQVLNRAASLSAAALPSDWVGWDTQTNQLVPLSQPNLVSQYGFDAYRVWWRVALDAAIFAAPEAQDYLRRSLNPLRQRWQTQTAIPAQIDLQGEPRVAYESLAQYGMLYAAFRQVDPSIADQIYQKKLAPHYQDGFWQGDSAYYTQNLVWLGLMPPSQLKALFTRPNS